MAQHALTGHTLHISTQESRLITCAKRQKDQDTGPGTAWVLLESGAASQAHPGRRLDTGAEESEDEC
jgi:hypothetical protein